MQARPYTKRIKDNKKVLRDSGGGQGWEAGRASRTGSQSDGRLLDSNTGCSETVEQCLPNSAENNFQPGIPFLAKRPIERTPRRVECQMQIDKLIRSAGGGKIIYNHCAISSGESHQWVGAQYGAKFGENQSTFRS